MKTRLLFSAAILALLLAGCVTPTNDWRSPLDGRTAVYSWNAAGQMRFTCSYDKEGPYWQASGAEIVFTDDDGRETARMGRDGRLQGRDGSEAHTEINVVGGKVDVQNLRPALYAVTTTSPAGMLHGISWIERRRVEGGMPLAACSPAQRGQRLEVPFTARFVFWR